MHQVGGGRPSRCFTHAHTSVTQAQTAASNRPAVGGALQWLRNLGHSAQNMVSGRSDDAAEDPAYLKVKSVKQGRGHMARLLPRAAIECANAS